MSTEQIFAIAEPTIYHKQNTCEDCKVWKISFSNGRTLFCERKDHLDRNRVPLTVYGDSFFSQKNGLRVCTARIPFLSRKPIGIITVRDGFVAPDTWYGLPGQTEIDLSVPRPVRKQVPVKQSTTDPELANIPVSPKEDYPALTSGRVASSHVVHTISWAAIARNA